MKKELIEKIIKNGGIYDTAKYRYKADADGKVRRANLDDIGTTAILDNNAWTVVGDYTGFGFGAKENKKMKNYNHIKNPELRRISEYCDAHGLRDVLSHIGTNKDKSFDSRSEFKVYEMESYEEYASEGALPILPDGKYYARIDKHGSVFVCTRHGGKRPVYPDDFEIVAP